MYKVQDVLEALTEESEKRFKINTNFYDSPHIKTWKLLPSNNFSKLEPSTLPNELQAIYTAFTDDLKEQQFRFLLRVDGYNPIRAHGNGYYGILIPLNKLVELGDIDALPMTLDRIKNWVREGQMIYHTDISFLVHEGPYKIDLKYKND